jgi:hypothetical protein
MLNPQAAPMTSSLPSVEILAQEEVNNFEQAQTVCNKQRSSRQSSGGTPCLFTAEFLTFPYGQNPD